MGYGFGIWLVYNKSLLSINKHIGHTTLSCFMKENEARNLYNELIHTYGKKTTIDINGHSAKLFDKTYYKTSENDLYAWGHPVSCEQLDNYKTVISKYNCEQPYSLHTSVQYESDINLLVPKFNSKINTESIIHLVNITSNNPSDWNLLL